MNNPGQSETAYIMDLEDAVYQAIATIEFLHGCLTDDTYSYAYPKMTLQRIEDLRALIPSRPRPCLHSNRGLGIEQGCDCCIYYSERGKERAQA